MTPRTFGIGIVGAGRVFEQHARACLDLTPRARLLAIAEIGELQLRRATARYFIPFAHRDYRSLLDRRDVDVVVVCTPPASHERIVIDALATGKFVVCEKPLAHSLEAVDRILAAARSHPGRLGTVFQFRYLPEVRRTRWLLDRGDLGCPLFGRFSRYARFESSTSAKRGKAPKAAKERADWWGRWAVAGGGIVMTQSIHDLDLMCHFFGTPTEVSALIDTLHEPIESEDSCVATVRFENGAVACCYGTMTAHRTTNAYDVIGTSASAHLPWALEATDRKRREQLLEAAVSAWPAPAASAERGTLRSIFASRLRLGGQGDRRPVTAHTPYLAAVLDAIEAECPLPVRPEEARASVELCTAIYTSGLTRRPVALPLDSGSRYYRGLSPLDYEARQTPGMRSHAPDLAASAAAQISGAAG